MPYLADSYELNLFRTGEVVQKHTKVQGTDMMNGDVRKSTAQQDKNGVTCVESVPNGGAVEEQNEDSMEGVEYTSRPPTPPESGAATPVLHIAHCPPRLRPLIPPPNYGATKSGAVYRSAFPQDRNIDFLSGLDVKTVLCLVGTEPSDHYNQWIQHGGIKRLRVDIAANKEGKMKTTWDSLCEALLIVMDCTNYPLHIHCNQGRHRTGCVIACFRKIQRWPIEDILAEYRAYANPKAREGDIDLIRAFDPEAVFEYAKFHGYLDDRPFMKRMDSAIGNIDALAEALSSIDGEDIGHISGLSSASTFSDDGIEMRMSNIDPLLESDAGSDEPASNGVVEILDATPVEARQHTGVNVLEDDGSAGSPSAIAEDTITYGSIEATASVVELGEDAMTPPAIAVSNPFE
ncbi:hypothetical protein LTR36_008149 [Oleoguttula mirabilis]|uniref:Uncharacterized protein n=1 Tax=Oleoguttula mirabilis TaxID=1507867 RepID=A0AAV9J8G2_9PEZI|nr:hypothetical protein LTR36_008149 [Oleoguttula mirabilis]